MFVGQKLYNNISYEVLRCCPVQIMRAEKTCNLINVPPIIDSLSHTANMPKSGIFIHCFGHA